MHLEPVSQVVPHVIAAKDSIAMVSRRTFPVAPAAAAVVSESMVAPR